MMVAADAPAIRLAPASNIASTFSATIRQASSSASASPTASFASRSRITSQDSNASMAPASQGTSAARGSQSLRIEQAPILLTLLASSNSQTMPFKSYGLGRKADGILDVAVVAGSP